MLLAGATGSAFVLFCGRLEGFDISVTLTVVETTAGRLTR